MTSSFDKFRAKVEAAANGNYYMQVSKKGKDFKFSSIKISSYIKKMSDDNDYIYITTHRLCGNIGHVKEYLMFLGCKEADIATCLKNSYNVANYEVNMAKIEAEIAAIPKPEKKKKNLLSYEDLLQVGEVLKSSKKVDKDETSEGMPIPGTPSRVKRSEEDIKSKLYNLPEGMALDITFFKPSTKTGARKVKRTKSGIQRALGSTLELNRIVFDFEFDSSIAVKFLQEIGKSEEEATTIVEAAKNFKPSFSEVNLLDICVKK